MHHKINQTTKSSFMKYLIYLFSISAFFIYQNIYSQTKSGMKENKNYSVEIIRYKIDSQNYKNFESAYTKAGKILEKSPYCIGYEIIHGEEEPDHYIVRIHWTSVNDHINGFRKSAEFGSFFNLVKPFFNNIEEMKHYQLTPINWNKI